MKPASKAVAYPGLPVVFAEGLRDHRERVSFHSHASLAVTDIHENAKTETSAALADHGISFTLDGRAPDDPRTSGALDLIRDMLAHAAGPTGIDVQSSNHNILTGSSDSGAAALVWCMDDILELGLPVARMVELGLNISETAYRSIIGGLSQCFVDQKGQYRATQIRPASAFGDLMIYAIPFPDIRRFTADDLHQRVVRHPRYGRRSEEADEHIRMLNKIMDKGDLLSFMKLAETEATTVHGMFNDMGMDVIKPKMREAIDLVIGMRERGIGAYWTAAGGSAIYVYTLKRWSREVTRELKDHDYKYRHYKVADGAKAV